MERSFSKGDKRVDVEELTDLIATKKGRPEEDDQPPLDADSLLPEISDDQLRAFENAGWKFEKRTDNKPASESEGKVFVKKGGRIAVGTNYLTLQLKDVPKEEADRTLRPFGLKVVEELRFAPGLVRAAVIDESAGDVIDIANKLMESGKVVFAEPELIEITGPRSA